MDQDTLRIPRESLFEFTKQVFVLLGISPEHAATEASWSGPTSAAWIPTESS